MPSLPSAVAMDALREEVATLRMLLEIHEQQAQAHILALRASEERQRATLMSVGDGVVTTDAAGRVELMNPEAETLTGWTQAEAMGRKIDEVFVIVNEDTRLAVENPIWRVLRDGVVVGLANHTILIARDGTTRPIADSGAPIRGAAGGTIGVVLVFRDQTAERAADIALRQSRERFRELVENLNEVVFAASDTAVLSYISPVVQTLLGYTPGDLVGRTLIEVVHPDDQTGLRAIIAEVLAGKLSPGECRMLTRDGRVRWVRISARQQVADGRITGLQGSLKDITAYRQAVEARLEGEARYRVLYMDSSDAIMVLTPGVGFTAGNPATIRLFHCRDEADFTTRSPASLSPERQPDGSSSGEKALAMMQLAMERGSHAFEWTHRRTDGSEFQAAVLLSRCDIGGTRLLQATVRDLTGQKREAEKLAAAYAEAELLLATVSAALIGVDTRNRITRWNIAAERMFGKTAAAVLGRELDDCGVCCDWDAVFHATTRCIETRRPQEIAELRYVRPLGGDGFLAVTVDASWAAPGTGHERLGMVLLARDITEHRLRAAQQQQGAKLESLGQLAAGIAHEINTPIQFIGDNLRFIADASSGMAKVHVACSNLITAMQGHIPADLLAEVRAAERTADIEYTLSESPKAIQQSLEGVERVAGLVKALKEFSHPDQGRNKELHDLNHALLTTIVVAKNEYKYVADVVTDLDPALPMVPSLLGEINQVVLNLLVNAAHAIGEAINGGARRGTITVSSRRDGDWVEIRVADTGPGVPDSIRRRIFEPFFTTKPLGKGTGQGLYLSQMIVVQNHRGTLTFEPRSGGGTTFIMRLPMSVDKSPCTEISGS